MMKDVLRKNPELEDVYDSMYISFDELFSNYNTAFRFD
jgi:hypothetical protein